MPAAVVRLITVLVMAGTASGHPLSVSYSRFQIMQNDVDAVFRLPMDDMDLLMNLDRNLDGSISEDELRAAGRDLEPYLRKHVDLAVGQSRLTPELERAATWTDSAGAPYLEAHVRYRSARAIERLQVRVRLLTDLYPNHRNLAEAEVGGDRRQFVFQHGNTWSIQVDRPDAWSTVREFSTLGVEHIITGYDHLLFLLGLLIVSVRLRNLIAVVTAFAVAHSLTLALAVTNVVSAPDRLIEAAIALSIVYVGVENLIGRSTSRRWVISFAFGLVHGLGFAGILREMHLDSANLILSLVSFNAGVEIGQVLIVACAWPVLSMIQTSRHGRLVVISASSAVVVAGLFWFTERIA